ncbi:MAG: hypothetical protein CL897_02040 [Dehalococcoidia bacterium]|nr:hypothetical protein [Dehalococcoidia bacterium]
MPRTLTRAGVPRPYYLARLAHMSFLVGIVLLPFFVWSWIKHDSDEDAAAALSIGAWIVIGLSVIAAIWFVFG